MPRSALRYVEHRITQHPDTDVTFEVECLTCECGWQATPVDGRGRRRCRVHEPYRPDRTRWLPAPLHVLRAGGTERSLNLIGRCRVIA